MQIAFEFSDNLLVRRCRYRYGAAEHGHDSGRGERLFRRGRAQCRVTMLNDETNLTRTVITGENGAFRAPTLPVGHYRVSVELAGFQAQAQRGLILEVAQELVVNPTLEVALIACAPSLRVCARREQEELRPSLGRRRK